jgi:hypothetical protein
MRSVAKLRKWGAYELQNRSLNFARRSSQQCEASRNSGSGAYNTYKLTNLFNSCNAMGVAPHPGAGEG